MYRIMKRFKYNNNNFQINVLNLLNSFSYKFIHKILPDNLIVT